MTDRKKDDLEELSIRYRELHALASEYEKEKKATASEIKELLGDDDYKNEMIKVSHVSKKVIAYKQMIEDANITVPEKYISIQISSRITIA